MLAAGRGSRLYGEGEDHPNKALLSFGGRTLLDRHVDILRAAGIDELVLVVGYRAESMLAEVARIGAEDFVRPVHNPDYQMGSVVSLLCGRAALESGDGCLFMDADVLYAKALIDRLMGSTHDTCFLLDRNYEPGDEPVKLCIRDGRPVEFRKATGAIEADFMGEWPGFLKLSPAAGKALVQVMETFMAAGREHEPMEEAIREVMLAGRIPFGWEDITGVPWIEIDFPGDVARAEREILPRLDAPTHQTRKTYSLSGSRSISGG